jgi:hypothetical protein
MPRGDKSKYTATQKRKARLIEESYEKRGLDEAEAAARAWATVNKQTGAANAPAAVSAHPPRARHEPARIRRDAPSRPSTATRPTAVG